MNARQKAQESILSVPQEDFLNVPEGRKEEINNLTACAVSLALSGDMQSAVSVTKAAMIAMYANGKKDATNVPDAFKDVL